jgi:hypothetical protein
MDEFYWKRVLKLGLNSRDKSLSRSVASRYIFDRKIHSCQDLGQESTHKISEVSTVALNLGRSQHALVEESQKPQKTLKFLIFIGKLKFGLGLYQSILTLLNWLSRKNPHFNSFVYLESIWFYFWTNTYFFVETFKPIKNNTYN